MQKTAKIIITAMAICCGLTSVCSAAGSGRVLHFPADRSVGKIFILDDNVQREIKGFCYWTENGEEWKYHCPAKGTVHIPAGKRVKLITNWNRKPAPGDMAKLKPDDLHSLVLQCGRDKRFRADNGFMESVGRLTGLRSLNISDSNITNRGLLEIQKLNRLQRLTLGKGITNSGVRIIENLKSLKGLYLKDCRISDAGLEKICENLSLEELELFGKKLTDEGLAHLSKIPTLSYLMLQGNTFTDVGMAYLKDIASLKTLHAGSLYTITDAGVKHLAQHPCLERITFHWNKNITDKGIGYLKGMRSLKKLDIGYARITGKAIIDLKQVETLEYLHLPSTGLTDADMAHVAELANLKYLFVGGSSDSPLTDKSLSSIAKLKKLEQLYIGGAGFTDEGMDHIAGLSNLKKLELFKVDLLTDDGLAKLARLKFLTKLSLPLGSKIHFTDEGLRSLENLPSLEWLQLTSDTDFSNKAIERLRNKRPGIMLNFNCSKR